MATFIMCGKYSSEGIKGISAKRTEKAESLIKELGGEVKSMYALLGDHDLVIIAELPGINEAIKASLAMGKQTGISFSTSPAVSVEEFDRMSAGL